MQNKCLYCYQPLEYSPEFHDRCSKHFFGNSEPPMLVHTLDEMSELAKHVVNRSVTVPGVQPKLSLSIEKEIEKNSKQRLTVVGALGGN